MLVAQACGLSEAFVCRQEASGAEIEAKRSKNTKTKVRGRLGDAMLKGGLSTVAWLIEHHGGLLASNNTDLGVCAQALILICYVEVATAFSLRANTEQY